MAETARILMLCRDPCPQWQMDLRAELMRAGHRVSLCRSAGPKADQVMDVLRRFDRRLMGRGMSSPWHDGAPAVPQPEDDAPLEPADLVLDLGGGALASEGRTLLVPLYDGRPGEAAILDALIGTRVPAISIAVRDGEDGAWRVLAEGLPSLEQPHGLVRCYDRVLRTTAHLILKAIRNLGEDRTGAEIPPPAGQKPAPTHNALGLAAGALAHRIGKKARKLVWRPDHWRIGWRRLDGGGVQEKLAFPERDYEFLPDDGRRYYADPFLFEHEGETWLFCEEFDYAAGKGLIAVTRFGADGRPGTPQTILEAPCHLSYPQVFARDGAIWMIPETCAAGRIELWRAESFPDRWSLAQVLVPDVRASDATILDHDGRLWLFATIADLGSTWDTLALWYADRLEGPWTAHPANPVLIDARAARPAGAFFRRGAELWRSVQDCTGGYGSGLALCRVDRLDPQGFSQTLMARLPPRPQWRGDGTHTLNVGGGYEVIDVVGRKRRF